jgi:hypothetical protein
MLAIQASHLLMHFTDFYFSEETPHILFDNFLDDEHMYCTLLYSVHTYIHESLKAHVTGTVCMVLNSDGCARNYRPCFRENQPKRLFSIK